MLSVSETSPGRVFYRGVCVTVKSSPTILPFRVYALPLQRESIPEDWSVSADVAAPSIIAG